MIDKMDDDFKCKMKEIGLKYNNEIPGEETIEINID
jgi:hypothetical protein